jgi:hypothetical protein
MTPRAVVCRYSAGNKIDSVLRDHLPVHHGDRLNTTN